MIAGAKISECGKYRYQLWRAWDESLDRLAFIMLNPSTADGLKDDATIRKCVGFATRLGFGSISVANLFAYRATDPSQLKAAAYDEGPENPRHLVDVLRWNSGPVVCAWGANARGHAAVTLLHMHAENNLRALYCLRKLSDGTPAHPLMLPYSCKLEPYP